MTESITRFLVSFNLNFIKSLQPDLLQISTEKVFAFYKNDIILAL